MTRAVSIVCNDNPPGQNGKFNLFESRPCRCPDPFDLRVENGFFVRLVAASAARPDESIFHRVGAYTVPSGVGQ